MAIDNPKYGSAKNGYLKWKEYINSFGLGRKLGIDLPSENKANIPDTAAYNKDFGNPAYWNSCFMLTLGIGQDRMTATPLQLANTMALIANEGYYYTPHLVDSIEEEDSEDKVELAKFRTKQDVTKISSDIYKVIKEGMHDVTIKGTATGVKLPGHEYCAKTGTAQNPHGKNHSIFVCFAPKDNPKVAVAVVVENAGYGATWAGPISSLLMEKYLNDTLTTESTVKADNLAKVDLMPEEIKAWYIKNNSNRLTPVDEYKNDELGDVWEMEMVSEYKPKPKVQDTINKIIDSTNKTKIPTEPIDNNIKANDTAILIEKKKKKTLPPKNVKNT
jgi:penicillin-binding protein 2